MEHFKGIVPEQRWKNELMEHMERQTIALEQIAQLLQSHKKEGGQDASNTNKRTPIKSASNSNRGKRSSGSNSNSGKSK